MNVAGKSVTVIIVNCITKTKSQAAVATVTKAGEAEQTITYYAEYKAIITLRNDGQNCETKIEGVKKQTYPLT